LEYGAVSGKIEPLEIAELGFWVDKASITKIMHGIRLAYSEVPGIHAPPSPVVKIAPILFLGTRFGTWVTVKSSGRDETLPHDANWLGEHLARIQEAAKRLLQETRGVIGKVIEPLHLVEHYEDDSFDALPGVREDTEGHFVIVTGSETHYLRTSPTVPDCPWHDWPRARGNGCATEVGPLLTRSVQPRAFFTSGEVHHCAHRGVKAAKSIPISAQNRGACGSRSGVDGQAFCEIWRFETQLCCRTCAFESVCTKVELFQLPCRRREGS
jgi:hypothetical protein